MLVWLSLIAASLIAMFVYFLDPGASIEGVPHWAIALAGIAVLGLLYGFMAKPRTSVGSGAFRIAAVLASLAVSGAAVLYVLAEGPSLQGLATRAASPSLEQTPSEQDGAGSVLIRRNAAGRFVAKGEINGKPAELLVDTGAAAVILRQSDAERAGIDMSALKYSVPIETANGTAYAAPVRLRTVAVGAVQVQDLEALVAARGSLNESLLGMSFLRRLRSYELSGDFMTLRE